MPSPSAYRPATTRAHSEPASEPSSEGISAPPNPSSASPCKAGITLRRQLMELTQNPIEGISAGLVDDSDLFKWEVLIVGAEDTLYEGGIFRANLIFPKDYPMKPPKMNFITRMFHPNIYSNGNVCISILHEAHRSSGSDGSWLPVHTVETILISVLSMLNDPNERSAANSEAAALWRRDRDEYKRRVRECVRRSLED